MPHREPNNIIENLPSPRNVIMPRICYFLRVAKTGIYQKLCLPYNAEDQS
jgi:hypothetical protein